MTNTITLTDSLTEVTGIDTRKLLLRSGVNPNQINEDALTAHLNRHCLGQPLTDDQLGRLASDHFRNN